ncbi:MAG TPA: NAD(P)H-hydrate dehydratase [Roseococcus sp.]|nr:NAD(P)H-hydrate dehydratase [Roseococcus sp.]
MSAPIPVTEALLRTMPLPTHREGEDKDQRGRILVIGGSPTVPGGAMLAAVAALRAGAGKLQVATCASIAPHMAVTLPEALVAGHPETHHGAIAPTEAGALAKKASRVDAVVLGPGMMEGGATAKLVSRLLRKLEGEARLVADAAALAGLETGEDRPRHLAGRMVLTPHAGEMSRLMGEDRDAILADPLAAARRCAAAHQAVVIMKGGCSFIATPQGLAWSSGQGNVGLATSGSGDALAGIIGGLLARGASPADAAVWGCFLHGEAGNRLARRMGPVGFLARELAAEVPAIMAELAPTA